MKDKYNPTSYWGLSLAVIISVGFVLNTFSWAFITGQSGFWMLKGNDLTQHLSGLNMYLSCQWQFPLLAFDSLNYPQGTRVTFIDGIPIFAFLLKIFLPHNIGFVSPFGYWLVLCFILQGVSAWWVTRELTVKSWVFLVFLVCVFLTYPVLMERLRYIALMSHWIILFAIALYLRGYRLKRLPIAGWTVLFPLSFYIHIYFFAMVLGIYMAAILETKHKLTIRHIFLLISPLIVLGASLFIFLLPLPAGLKSEVGFDTLAMDMLSPFYGGAFIQLQADLSQHQDGFNYLGLGVIFIFAWVLFSQFSKNLAHVRKHWAFFSVMLMYLIYSLSNKIYFGGVLVAVIDYPHGLSFVTEQLRASGRFFWPVGYAIIIYSFYGIYQQSHKKYLFNFSMIIILLVQWADINQYYQMLQTKGHQSFHPVNQYLTLDQVLAKQVKVIYLYPTLVDAGYAIKVLLPMMQYAAMRGYKLNTGFIARYGIYRKDISVEISQSSKKTSAYVFSKLVYTDIEQVYKVLGEKNSVDCKSLDMTYVCQFQ